MGKSAEYMFIEWTIGQFIVMLIAVSLVNCRVSIWKSTQHSFHSFNMYDTQFCIYAKSLVTIFPGIMNMKCLTLEMLLSLFTKLHGLTLLHYSVRDEGSIRICLSKPPSHKANKLKFAYLQPCL